MAGRRGTAMSWIRPSAGVCAVLCPMGVGAGGGGEVVLGGRVARNFLGGSLLDLNIKALQAHRERWVWRGEVPCLGLHCPHVFPPETRRWVGCSLHAPEH